jgi:hypothetical protein
MRLGARGGLVAMNKKLREEKNDLIDSCTVARDCIDYIEGKYRKVPKPYWEVIERSLWQWMQRNAEIDSEERERLREVKDGSRRQVRKGKAGDNGVVQGSEGGDSVLQE